MKYKRFVIIVIAVTLVALATVSLGGEVDLTGSAVTFKACRDR